MRSAHGLLFAVFVLLSLIPAGSDSQSCSMPESSDYPSEMEELDVEEIMNQTFIINGSAYLEGDLLVRNSTVIIQGKGIYVGKNSTLDIRDSLVLPGDGNPGYYIELSGNGIFINTTLKNCTDPENSYFGLYVGESGLMGENLVMESSSMIRSGGGDVNLNDSVIEGLISYSGNFTLVDTDVTGSGVSQIGTGTAAIRDTRVYSNKDFTTTAGIYSIDADLMEIEDSFIGGSYNGGISSVRSPVSIKDTEIELQNGTIAIELNDLNILKLEGISTNGTELGIYLHNCSASVPLKDLDINCTIRGMNLRGNNPLELDGIRINDADSGLSIGSPTSLFNCIMTGNRIGIKIEDDSLVNYNNCSISDWGQWALEVETWESRTWAGLDLRPGNGSIGTVAWWGWTDIQIRDRNGFEITGSEIVVRSPFGNSFQVVERDVGLIWGYQGYAGIVDELTYRISARWGTARANVTFSPSEGRSVEIELPMTDLWLHDLVISNGSVSVSVTCNGSEANELEISLFQNGIERNAYRTQISEGETKMVRLPLSDLELNEKYDIEVIVSSRDEYMGAGGSYLENNVLKTTYVFEEWNDEEKDRDHGLNLIILLVLTVLSFVMLIVPILLKRR